MRLFCPFLMTRLFANPCYWRLAPPIAASKTRTITQQSSARATGGFIAINGTHPANRSPNIRARACSTMATSASGRAAALLAPRHARHLPLQGFCALNW
jgi:hypothetical protein